VANPGATSASPASRLVFFFVFKELMFVLEKLGKGVFRFGLNSAAHFVTSTGINSGHTSGV
jgi:hypothetical protein